MKLNTILISLFATAAYASKADILALREEMRNAKVRVLSFLSKIIFSLCQNFVCVCVCEIYPLLTMEIIIHNTYV